MGVCFSMASAAGSAGMPPGKRPWSRFAVSPHTADKAENKLSIAGVGGAHTVDHVRAYLRAGADAVMLATSVMVDPAAGLEIRRDWSREEHPTGSART